MVKTMEEKILEWIDDYERSVIDPDGEDEHLTLEELIADGLKLDEGEQSKLQVLGELRDFMKEEKNG